MKMACIECHCMHIKCVKIEGEEKCCLCLLHNIVCKTHQSMQGHCSDLMKKHSMLDAHHEQEQHVQSLPNIVDLSECANDLDEDEHVRCVQSSLDINLMLTFSNLESDVNASSEYEDVCIDCDDKSLPDTTNWHGHIGIDLTGDTHNSIGIWYDFHSKKPKTMLKTPSRGMRCFL